MQQRIPLPEMTELLITPQLPEYPKIANDVFMLLLDGKLRSRTETLKFLKPLRSASATTAASATARTRRQSCGGSPGSRRRSVEGAGDWKGKRQRQR